MARSSADSAYFDRERAAKRCCSQRRGRAAARGTAGEGRCGKAAVGRETSQRVAAARVAAGVARSGHAARLQQLGTSPARTPLRASRCCRMTCTLSWQLPNIWYEAHLTCRRLRRRRRDACPDVPYVIVGHNQRIAWGFTNLGPNVEDIYVEKFNDQGQYLTPQGWMQPQHRQEIIRVKGEARGHAGRGDHAAWTRSSPTLFPARDRKLALKWTAYDPQTSHVAVLRRRLGAELAAVPGGVFAVRQRRHRTWFTPMSTGTSDTRRRD